MNEQVMQAVAQADLAIRNEDFDRLVEFYTDDAVPVVKLGMVARGNPHCICGHCPLFCKQPCAHPGQTNHAGSRGHGFGLVPNVAFG